MSLEELWFQSSNMNTQRSGGVEGGGGGSDQSCCTTLDPPRDYKFSMRRRSEKRKERTERKCLLIKQREDGEKHESKRSLTRGLFKPPFFEAQFIYSIH